MEGGYFLDKGHSSSEALTWIEGPPDRSMWGTMKTKGRKKLKIYGWRCPECSLLRIYAPEEEEEDS